VTSEESVEGGELEGGAEVKRVEKAVFDGRGGEGGNTDPGRSWEQ
jgi:hypothetical protein